MNSLLVLSPAFPYPPHSGGDIRLFELLRRLSAHFDLHLLAYGSGDVEEFMRRSGVKTVELVPGGQAPPAGGLLKGKLDFWAGAPHGLRLDVDPSFWGALGKSLDRVRPGAVLIEHVYMTQYRQFISGHVPVFVSCHNVETTKLIRWFSENKAGLLREFRRRLQVRVMRRRESTLGRLAHTVFVTSEVDAEELRRMNCGGRFLCAPNGADLETFALRGPETFVGPPAAIFVGSLFYKPNLDAAMMLKHDIWPKVRKAIPEAVCHIAGRHDGLDLSPLDNPSEGLRFHGLVPDIRPYLTMCQAMVVPLRVGSGTRIKIIESMATGTPVVSTRIGAEGIHCTHNTDILLADSVEALSKAVASLLNDREMACRIGRAGRSLVEKYYNWDRSAECMRQAMQGAMQGLSGPSPRPVGAHL